MQTLCLLKSLHQTKIEETCSVTHEKIFKQRPWRRWIGKEKVLQRFYTFY